MTQPQPVGRLLPDLVADLARRHGTQPPTLTNRRPAPMPEPETVWRFQLPLADRTKLKMPAGAILLSVGPFRQPSGNDGYFGQNQPIDLWAVVDPTAPTEERTFFVVGTGHPMPKDAGTYVGTTHSHSGALIWHVFEAKAEQRLDGAA